MSKFQPQTEAFAHLCPKTWQRISEKRYLLPKHRQSDYLSQIELIDRYVGYLTNFLEGAFDQTELRSSAHFGNLAIALEYRRPTYFLERELGEIFCQQELPSVAQLERDIKWKFPHLRVLLPLGLLNIEPEGKTNISLSHLDIFHTPPNQTVQFPQEISWELDHCKLLAHEILKSGVSVGDRKMTFPSRDGFGVCSDGEDPKNPSQLIVPSIMAYWDQIDGRKGGWFSKAQDLALNILWFLSTVPEEIIRGEEIVRKPKKEGDRLISGLYNARFIGQVQRSWSKTQPKTPTASKVGSHTPHIGHWVAGHNTQQTHGPNHSLRKTQWISTYWAEGNKEQPSP